MQFVDIFKICGFADPQYPQKIVQHIE